MLLTSQNKYSKVLGELHPDRLSLVLILLGICAVLCITAAGLFIKLPPILILGAFAIVPIGIAVFKWPHIGAIIYVLVQFIRPAEVWPALASLRLELLLVVLCVMAWVINTSSRKSDLKLRFHPIHAFLLLLLMSGFLGIPFAVEKTQAVLGAYELFKVVAGYALVTTLCRDEKHVKWLVAVFVICAFIQWQWLFRGYFSGAIFYRMGIVRAIGATETLKDPNAMANYLLSAVPLIFLVIKRMPTWGKALFSLLMVGYAFGVALTGSRTGYITGFVLSLCYWLKAKNKLVYLIVAALAIGIMWNVVGHQYQNRFMTIFRPMDSSYETGDYGSARERIKVMKTGIHIFLDHPATGTGATCFRYIYHEYTGIYLQPHSVYVQVAAELGLPGLFGFFGMAFLIFKYCRLISKKLKESGNSNGYIYDLTQAIRLVLLVLLISGFFAHSMYRFTYYFLAALTVICWRLTNDQENDDLQKSGVSLGQTSFRSIR